MRLEKLIANKILRIYFNNGLLNGGTEQKQK